MKITFLIANMSKRSGGPPNDMINLGGALAAMAGVQVQVLAAESADALPLPASVRGIFLPRNFAHPRHIWGSCRIIRRNLRESDFVFVWGIWGPIEGLFFRLLRPAGCRYAVKIIGMLETYIMSRNSGRKRLARFLYLERNLEQAETVLVDTEVERQRVTELRFAAKVGLSRNGVRLPRLIGIARERKTMAYMGRIVPKKGLDFLLDALGALREKHPELRLRVAGRFDSPEFQAVVEAAIRRHNLGPAVEFLGHVAGPAHDELLQGAGCFVLPSHSEGFSNAVLEALAAGTPVFITPGCNFPEVETTGLGRVVPMERQQWVQALDDYFSGRSRTIMDPAAIRAHMAEFYSWEATAEGLLKIARGDKTIPIPEDKCP